MKKPKEYIWKPVAGSKWLKKCDLEFLELCKKHGYRKVSVSTPFIEIKSSIKHNVIFGDQIYWNKDFNTSTYPKMWDIKNELKLSFGCAGSDYAQIINDTMLRAAYKFENDEWFYFLNPIVIKERSEKYGL